MFASEATRLPDDILWGWFNVDRDRDEYCSLLGPAMLETSSTLSLKITREAFHESAVDLFDGRGEFEMEYRMMFEGAGI